MHAHLCGNTSTPMKRYRSEVCSGSPVAGRTILSEDSWVQYDVDVLDSAARRRKRAAAEVMSQELKNKLQVVGQPENSNNAELCVAAGADKDADSMQCSSAECSPAPTPQRMVCFTPSSSKVAHAIPAATAWPRLAQKPLQLGEQTPTSPTDPQLEGIDLRKATLMRQMMLKAGTEDGDMQVESTPVRSAQPSWPTSVNIMGTISPMRSLMGLQNVSPIAPRKSALPPCEMDLSPLEQIQEHESDGQTALGKSGYQSVLGLCLGDPT